MEGKGRLLAPWSPLHTAGYPHTNGLRLEEFHGYCLAPLKTVKLIVCHESNLENACMIHGCKATVTISTSR